MTSDEQTWKVLPRIRGYEIINQDGKVVGCYATPEIGQAHHVFALQEVHRLTAANALLASLLRKAQAYVSDYATRPGNAADELFENIDEALKS
jgi:hypothetical protein